MKYFLSLICSALLLFFFGCVKDPTQKEQYMKIAYLLSYETDNRMTRTISYFDDPNKADTSYITCGLGGSRPLEKNNVLFRIAVNEKILTLYNYKNYYLDLDKYESLLPPTHYTIPRATVEMVPSSSLNYSYIPFVVNSALLSPDGKYYIPIELVEVIGADSINALKKTVLIRIVVKNKYCGQIKNNLGFTRGFSTKFMDYENKKLELDIMGEPNKIGFILADRIVMPVSETKIRFLPYNIPENILKTGEDLPFALVADINEQTNMVTLSSNGSLQLAVPFPDLCKYDPEKRILKISYDFLNWKDNTWYRIEDQILELEETEEVKKT